MAQHTYCPKTCTYKYKAFIKLKSLQILPTEGDPDSLCCHLQVTLNCNMGRACSLTRGRTGVIAVDAVVVPVVFIPHVGTPLHLTGQRMLGILHLLAILGAQLLTQLHSTGGTDLHALATGNTVIGFRSR